MLGKPSTQFGMVPSKFAFQPLLFGDKLGPLGPEPLLGLPEHLRPQSAVAANSPNLVDHYPLDFAGGQ